MAKQIVAVTQCEWGDVGHAHVMSVRFQSSMAGASVATVLRHLALGHEYYIVVAGKRFEVDAWTCDRCGRTTPRAYAMGSWNDALASLAGPV